MPKSVSVCLSFDFDAMSVWLTTMRSRSLSTVSRGEFGKVGTERLLDTLSRYQVPSSWFIPGHTIETFPDLVKRVADAGHEIGHHGYCHENPASVKPDEEQRILERGIACIRRTTGKNPIGYRSPAADLSPHSVSLLVEFGFLYDSSMMANDFTPYYCRVGDDMRTDGPYVFDIERHVPVRIGGVMDLFAQLSQVVVKRNPLVLDDRHLTNYQKRSNTDVADG